MNSHLQKFYRAALVRCLSLIHGRIMNPSPSQEIVDTLRPKRFDWINAAVICLSPLAAIVASVLYLRSSDFHFSDFLAFAVMYALTGLGICAGYHRYYSHRAFECSRPMQGLMLLFGAAALQNSVLSWVSDHRYHHRYTDRDEDPYNIGKGFFWAHVGWILFTNTDGRSLTNVKDLRKDSWVELQHRYYLPIALAVGLGVPFLIGLAFGNPWGGLLWGGLVRTVVVHHATFLINSAAHTFGNKPHSEAGSARDNWWLPFLSFGEGYHNYHHAYPSDYRNGIAWYHWDPTKWIIRAMAIPGWTWNLRRSELKMRSSASSSARFIQSQVAS
jgi:stearoyl-CoA desaturase (Delta-9 desaturase)